MEFAPSAFDTRPARQYTSVVANDRTDQRTSGDILPDRLQLYQVTHRRGRDAAADTGGTPHQCPLPAGRRLARSGAAIPRNPAGALSIQVIQTPVKFFALRGRQWKGVRRPGEVFPDLVHERQLLFRTQLGDVNTSHVNEYTAPPPMQLGRSVAIMRVSQLCRRPTSSASP